MGAIFSEIFKAIGLKGIGIIILAIVVGSAIAYVKSELKEKERLKIELSDLKIKFKANEKTTIENQKMHAEYVQKIKEEYILISSYNKKINDISLDFQKQKNTISKLSDDKIKKHRKLMEKLMNKGTIKLYNDFEEAFKYE